MYIHNTTDDSLRTYENTSASHPNEDLTLLFLVCRY